MLTTSDRNEFAFEIIQLLKEEYNQNKSVLLGVYFHELQKYACSYYLCKNSKIIYEDKIIFPFINTNYVNNTPKLEFKTSPHARRISKIAKIISLLSQLIFTNKSIDLSDQLPINYQDMLLHFIYRYKISIVANQLLYIKNKNVEISIIRNTLNKLTKKLNINNPIFFIDNFISFIESSITEEKPHLKSKVFICTSTMSIRNRIMAANYQNQNIPVISIGHGFHSVYVYNEPFVGYGELSFCDHYITYGNNLDFSKNQFFKSLTKTPQIHFRGSKFIESLNNNHNLIVKNNSPLKILYIPTSFSGSHTYGPYRDMEDYLYYDWQNTIGESLGDEVTYKAYLTTEQSQIPTNFKNIERQNLKDIVNNFDIFVIDYLSTASAIVQATNKPILFFNIGLRNLSPDVEEVMKKRFQWVDINFNANLNLQIKDAYEKIKQNPTFENLYNQNYCINDTFKNDTSILLEVLNKLT